MVLLQMYDGLQRLCADLGAKPEINHTHTRLIATLVAQLMVGTCCSVYPLPSFSTGSLPPTVFTTCWVCGSVWQRLSRTSRPPSLTCWRPTRPRSPRPTSPQGWSQSTSFSGRLEWHLVTPPKPRKSQNWKWAWTLNEMIIAQHFEVGNAVISLMDLPQLWIRKEES